MKEWYFPGANGLGIHGISDGGVETYNGTVIESLTREICQNSLDASNGKKPVKIEFNLSFISKDKFPGYKALKGYMYDAKKYWEERNNYKSIEFFSEACKILESDRIPVLRISDFNTTGLIGSKDPKQNSPWFSMVYSEGVSNKSGSNSGSFGIGKSSIYAASSLRTAFFNTYDAECVFAAQGVSKLATFVSNGETKYGYGFFGVRQDNGLMKCCESIESLDDIYYRTDYGTDIFIMGFNNFSDWKENVVISLLDNFLLAIYDGNLEIVVQDVIVNKDTLKSLLNEYKNKNKKCTSAYCYYEVLESSEEEFRNTELIKDMPGIVKLKVLIFKEGSPNRTVLISRSNGMKLYDMKNISGSIQFSAILTMEGEKLNQYFARMEDPTHTKWQADRYDQEKKIKEANNVIKKLKSWIKSTIRDKGTEFYGDETEIEGMEGLLPNFYELAINKKKREFLENKKSKISVNKKRRTAQSSDIKTPEIGESYYEYEDTGVMDPKGEFETVGLPSNAHSEQKGGQGGLATGSEGEGNRPIKNFTQINNFKKRIFISNVSKNEYTIRLTTNQNIEDSRLKIFVAGESTNIDAKITAATADGKALRFNGNVLYLGKIHKRFPKTIRFNINADFQCNLEVKLYADSK